jgi:hypothetical protein
MKMAADISVWSLGGNSFLGEMENAELIIDNVLEDGSGINERWTDMELAGSSWRVEGEAHVDTIASIVAEAAGDAILTLSIDTDAGAYTGTGILRTASHQHNRRTAQKQRFTLEGKGALTVA